jgi:hypothetical protein
MTMTTEATAPRAAENPGSLAWTPLDACPACGATELHPVYDGELLNFLCSLCLSCWHVELGFIHRIRPETCPGCQYELICAEHQRQLADVEVPVSELR